MQLAGSQVVPGFLHGLSQPGVRLHVRVGATGRADPGASSQAWSGLAPLPPGLSLRVLPAAGMPPGELLLELLAEGLLRLQISAGLAVTAGAVVEAARPLTGPAQPSPAAEGMDVWLLAPSPVPVALQAVVQAAVAHLNAVWQAPSGSVPGSAETIAGLVRALARFVPPGTNARHLLREAGALRIPVTPLPAGVFQFGWGRRARLFNSSITDSTPALAVAWAKDKRATNALLRLGGLPVPVQLAVESLDAAVAAAGRIGYPVVLKPAALDQGRGVEADLRHEAELRAAFVRSRAHATALVVERHVPGEDYRVYVVQGRVLAAAHRVPARVVGDGATSVAALVEAQNAQRSRTGGGASVYKPIEIDEEALALLVRQGLAPEAVPAPGQVVTLRRSANASRGGSSVDVTARMHPDNAVLCVRAASLLRLDIAGLDLLMPDIARSWREGGAAFCEVNAQPQMGGAHPWIFGHILRQLMPTRGRIPAVLVLAPAADEDTGRAVAAALESAGLRTRRLQGSAEQLLADGRAAVLDPDTAAIVLGTDGTGVERWGLPLDGFDALVLGNWPSPSPHLPRTVLRLAPLVAGVAFIDAPLVAGPGAGQECLAVLTRLLGSRRVQVTASAEVAGAVVRSLLEERTDGG